MSKQAAELLDAFESLSEKEKRIFTAEFLRRTIPSDSGALDDDETALAADQLFEGLDADITAARLRKSQPNAGSARPNQNPFRSLELQWLATHRQEYPGLWLALEADVLVASSKSLIEVLRQARHKGFANPLVAWSEDSSEIPFGGW